MNQLKLQLKHPKHKKIAEKLLKQDFKPIQQNKDGKKHPGVKGWPDLDLTHISNEPTWGAGICSRADGKQAFDCDIEDETLAKEFEDLIRKECGGKEFYKRTAAVTYPRLLIILNIEGLDRKIVSDKFEDKDGNTMQIEIFAGNKSQYLIAGNHPKGGEYECEPELGSLEELPTVSERFARELLKKFNKRCTELEFKQVTRKGKEQEPAGRKGIEAPYGSAQAVFNRKATIEDMLEMLLEAGWVAVNEEVFNHEPSYILRRPGKEEGISARLYAGSEDGTPLLHNFSSSALNGEGTYSPFEFIKWAKFEENVGGAFEYIRQGWGCDNPLNGLENTEEITKKLEELIECEAPPEIIEELGAFGIGKDGVATVLSNHDITFKESELKDIQAESHRFTKKEKTQCEKLIELCGNCELLISQNKEPFIRPAGCRKAIPIDNFGNCLRKTARTELGLYAAKTQIIEALTHLGAIILEEGSSAVIAKRSYITQEGVVFIDLGDESGSVVVIDKSGWKVTKSNTEIIFQEGGEEYGELPMPDENGDIGLLWNLIHAGNDPAKKDLILASILQTFYGGGYFSYFHGSAGSSKTTAARLVLALVDPDPNLKEAGMSADTKKEDRQLLFDRNFALLIDNVMDRIFELMREEVCLASTGGAVYKRKLYADNALVKIPLKCNLILTGITFSDKYEDVNDRLLAVEFDPIPDKDKKDAAEVWQLFFQYRQKIFGGICDMLSKGLNADKAGGVHSRFPLLERRLDKALEQVGGFSVHLQKSFEENAAEHFENSPWTKCLLEVIKKLKKKQTAAELDKLMRVQLNADEGYEKDRILNNPKLWPKGVRFIGKRIKQEIPNLKKLGWQAVQERTKKGRFWSFEKVT